MKRFIFLLFCTLFFMSAQSQLLWKISGNGLKHSSYIFGSHPLIPVAFLDSVKGLYKAYNECNTIVSEINTNNIDESGKLKSAAMIPNDKTMEDYLQPDTFAIVDKELKSVLKIGLKEMSQMNPAIILDLYKLELFRMLTGVADDAQSDSYFQIVGNQQNKKVVALENVDQQLNVLYNRDDIAKNAHLLAYCVTHKDKLSEELLQFNKLYKKQKINDILLFEQSRQSKLMGNMEDIQAKIDQNNEDWVSKLPPIMYNKSCFITVNVEHLAGENGMLDRLRKKGFKVKAVEE